MITVDAEHILLEPSEFYAGKAPYLEGLELRFYPDHPSLFAAFQNGEIDGISQILPAEIPAASASEDLQLFSTTESSYLNIIFNLNNPNAPFLQDALVRQALYRGIDRERLIDETVNGQGIPADSLLLPENWAYNPNCPTTAMMPSAPVSCWTKPAGSIATVTACATRMACRWPFGCTPTTTRCAPS